MVVINGKNIKEFKGRVVSDKPEKTLVVEVEDIKIHPIYEKRYNFKKKYHVHDETNSATKGQLVRIRETRPLSKTKRWKLIDIIE